MNKRAYIRSQTFFMLWENKYICEWLEDEKMPPYIINLFHEKQIKGEDLTKLANIDLLHELGVTSLGHCIKLKLRIEKLFHSNRL